MIRSHFTWFYKDPRKTLDVNYDNKFQEFEKILQLWKFRTTTLYGRINIVKTLALAKLHYVTGSLEVNEEFIEKTQCAIFDFIWKGKPPKVKNKITIQNLQDGGLKIPDFEKYVLANRVTWVKRLLDNKSSNLSYLLMFLPDVDFSYFLNCNYNPNDLPLEIPTFYRQILFSWFFLKEEPQNFIEIRRETLFFNRYISIDGKYIFYPELMQNGLQYIDDLITEDGLLVSYEEFCLKFGNSLSPFQFMSVIDAIPNKWRLMLKEYPISMNVEKSNQCFINNKLINVEDIISKDVYWYLISQELYEPTCIQSWSERLCIKDRAYVC